MEPQAIYLNILKDTDIGKNQNTVEVNWDYKCVEALGEDELDTILRALEYTSNLILNKQGLFSQENIKIYDDCSLPM